MTPMLSPCPTFSSNATLNCMPDVKAVMGVSWGLEQTPSASSTSETHTSSWQLPAWLSPWLSLPLGVGVESSKLLERQLRLESRRKLFPQTPLQASVKHCEWHVAMRKGKVQQGTGPGGHLWGEGSGVKGQGSWVGSSLSSMHFIFIQFPHTIMFLSSDSILPVLEFWHFLSIFSQTNKNQNPLSLFQSSSFPIGSP